MTVSAKLADSAGHGDKLRLIYTTAYDPSANPTERLWPPFWRAVTHNHQRDNAVDLYRDAIEYFQEEDKHPERALRHFGSPSARTGVYSPAQLVS